MGVRTRCSVVCDKCEAAINYDPVDEFVDNLAYLAAKHAEVAGWLYDGESDEWFCPWCAANDGERS